MRCSNTCYCFILLSVTSTFAVSAAETVEFNRDIRGILSDKCFQCHGPDENSREAELRLDVVGKGEGPFVDRDGSFAIKPGNLDTSELWARITTDDEDLAMPPKDSHKEPLTDEQRELIRQWILQGAEYQDFWAFVPPKQHAAPEVDNEAWGKSRIDRFVRARLEEESREPQGRAGKRTLIRRVTFDLTGLPPTVQEVRDFLQVDSPTAYETLVDRLMNSPRYGEHMAKYWLDLVRFADTNGIHHDHYREMTPYRDWVIRSFNENLSFDKFVTYQLAGDLYEEPTVDQKIGSGFNRLHLVIDKGTAIPEESFHRNVVDRVTSVGTAFMGLTVGCAVCHDHKYDPISQKDFYSLYAFFNNIDSTPETPGRSVHAPFILLPNDEQKERMRKLEEQVADAKEQVDALKDKEPEFKVAEKKWKDLVKAKKEFEDTVPVSLIMKERDEVRPTHILIRGAYDQPGEPVDRNTPSFLPPLRSEGKTKSRMDLAQWLVDPQHPLTARVTVNRFWQQFFGVGLVKTSEDFGMQGELPSHPELLDDLSHQFVESGWDVKTLLKSIVTSQAYQQSSNAKADEYEADPDNRLLARGSRYRLDAEMIRDQILFVSGLLNEQMFGKSVKPPQPPDLWKNVSMVSSSTYAFTADAGPKIYRRSLYSFWKRAMPPPQMTIFDAPTREACIARRERTNTPLQALVLMNEEQYFKAAKTLATKLVEKHSNDEGRIRAAYESITSQLPDESELERLLAGLHAFREAYADDPAQAKQVTLDNKTATAKQRVELAAYTMIVNAMFNLDIAKTRQ